MDWLGSWAQRTTLAKSAWFVILKLTPCNHTSSSLSSLKLGAVQSDVTLMLFDGPSLRNFPEVTYGRKDAKCALPIVDNCLCSESGLNRLSGAGNGGKSSGVQASTSTSGGL